MQTYIEAVEHEKQHAREKTGDRGICEQPMIAVITAAGKLLFCAALPVFGACVFWIALLSRPFSIKCCAVLLRVVMQLIKSLVHEHSRLASHDHGLAALCTCSA